MQCRLQDNVINKFQIIYFKNIYWFLKYIAEKDMQFKIYLKHQYEVQKGHPIFEKDTQNLKKHEITHEIKKQHQKYEKNTWYMKMTPNIWKGHPKSEKGFYLAGMIST